MHSSTSSSERLTAADRPGIAQPVPERPIPAMPWAGMLLAVVALVCAATGAWEWHVRTIGLLAGDIEDGPSAWAEQRRRIDAGNVPVAIVGDSRILFDTDLDHFERMSGVRPVQLALPGTNALPFLENLAQDERFKGLLIVGITESSYFRTRVGLMAAALERYRYESPGQRSSFVIHRWLSQWIAFLDPEYRLSRMVQRLDPNIRTGVEGPYNDVWKISTVGADRQTYLWPQIEEDGPLRAHARAAWAGFAGPAIDAALVTTVIDRTIAAVKAVRAHGGDVIFVRPPSAPEVRVNEEKRLARTYAWDVLLAKANVRGIHFDDLPAAQKLVIPEYSHVSRKCATVFTDAYVRALARLTDRVTLRTDAPPPMSAQDCQPVVAQR